ncbi:cation-translocating P-type ATPase [Nocardia shimofusensis]|uniref:cation-translocating P-type ATPase n=1 Tax=Nocardia shimofusensis TaxID=228596 RepID=UPI0008309E21|nr:cation-translocating P-type ATPase [Nocardia shimofusensis]
MAFTLRDAVSSWWFEAPRTVVTDLARAGVRIAAQATVTAVDAPIRVVEAGARAGASVVEFGRGVGLGHEFGALLDPHARRSQRRVALHRDRATVEVRGLASDKGEAVVRALAEHLSRRDAVRWWRVNAVTGHVVVALAEGAEDVPELLSAIESVEADAEVDDLDWNRTVEHPDDREPVLSAGIQVAGDVCAMAVSGAGALLPLRGPARALRAAAAFTDTQPRVRRRLEQRLGRPRTDLLLTTTSALGNALGDRAARGVADLMVDTVQRSLVFTEALARYARWQQWEAEMGSRPPAVPVALASRARPADAPLGPVERVADEVAAGSMAGALATILGGRGVLGTTGALELGAPKAARACREAYGSTVSVMMSRAGALTLHPGIWRRLDRLSALVVDGETLLTSRRLVLAAEPADTAPAGERWTRTKVWSAAQRLLWHSDTQDDAALMLVHVGTGHPDRGLTSRPVWRELREAGEPVGKVLIGRELDERAHLLLQQARAAGLRVVLTGRADTADLRSLSDQFVDRSRSMSKIVRELQRDGHMVAVLSPRAHKAMAAADVAIGLARRDHGTWQIPWAADVVCRDMTQVHRVLAAVAPARRMSERGRSLALSAAALGGLLLAVAPERENSTVPMTAAHSTALITGAFTGWRAVRAEPEITLAPSLPWHSLEPDEVLARLPEPVPVPERSTGGARSLPVLSSSASFARHLRGELADPLTPILGVGAIATAILGSLSDAMLLSSVLAVNAVVSARQRQRAERALHRLLETERLTGRLVERGGENAAVAYSAPAQDGEVPAALLTIGDVIVVRPGEVVPADARLLRADDLEMDESGLTGESVTVEKHVAAAPGAAVADRTCMLFEGTTVVNGTGRAVVVAVGAETQAGRAASGAVPPEKGGVQAQLRQLTDRALPLTLTGGSVVTILGVLRGRVLRTAIADGVAVAVAAVPEGLPLVATVAQLAAARRLSRYGVLVRASRTVEALGRVDTLCFDKTGTLTEGRLRLAALADVDEQWSPAADSEDARRLLRTAARACPDPDDGPVVHATDRAVLDAAAVLGGDDRWDSIEEIPFESNRGYAAALGRITRKLRLIVKGAPEIVLARCTRVRAADGGTEPFDDERRERAERMVRELAEQGLRVLVVARRDLSREPDDVERMVGELTLLGFLGLADIPRPQSRAMVHALLRNGISVRMITGDHPVTAQAVAGQLGIEAVEVTTGADLDGLDETAQSELIERSTVFARIDPAQKVRIVDALRRAGHVVGMTGDGSNDAAAIRTADIGIGVAAHGSVAARNAADLVLTRPDPLALLHAIVEGRGMWRRVTDAVGVLVGGNAGEVAFTLYGTALSGRAPLGTRQFLLVNMLTDMFPAMALALSPDRDTTDPEGADDPEALARLASDRLAETAPAGLGADLMRTLSVRGIATASGASVAWTIGRYTGTRRRAATIGLVALIGTQLGQTLVSGYRSPMVWVTIAASGAVLGTVVMTPVVCTYFGCRPLGPVGWAVAGASAATATATAALAPALLTGRQEQPSIEQNAAGMVPVTDTRGSR